jgi:hypothetical protein
LNNFISYKGTFSKQKEVLNAFYAKLFLIFEEGIRRKPRRVECTQAVFDFFPFGFPFGLL